MENYYPIEFDGADFTIYNNGTAPAPCVITFIPRVDFLTLTITGLSQEPIKVNTILKDQELVIDGENRTVTLDGANYFSNYDAWEFPKVQPGRNDVSILNGQMADISIEYDLRYI